MWRKLASTSPDNQKLLKTQLSSGFSKLCSYVMLAEYDVKKENKLTEFT